jgi:hypothetical protein
MPTSQFLRNGKDINVKKLIVLATAVSAMAISAAANAQNMPQTQNFGLNLNANVNPVITLVSGTPLCTTPSSCNYGNAGTGAGYTSINLGAFTDASGKTLHSAGKATFNINSNANFTASLSSRYGGLQQNPTMSPDPAAPQTGVKIVYLTSLTVGANTVNGDSSAAIAPATPYASGANQNIAIGFDIPTAKAPEGAATAVLPAGNYQDTLTLTLTPTS